MGWVYNLGLATLLKKYVHDHKDQLEEKLNLDAVAECWTIRHFEESVLCELFGYKNIHEYYEDGSSVNFIEKIQTPSLFLISKDDPFLGRLPLPECKDNPNTVLAVTKRGGHVAFLQGLWPFGTSWMDTVSCEFLAPYLETPAARL
mmetsp:Transcript_7697/g.19773  ORF Transcript_7697/g.19773 Transcript_7697/m.19773 type:complete len:146 (+) Transcript_7697:154-591(+)